MSSPTGKLADVIVVAGNPLENVSALRSVKTTVKGGVVYDSARSMPLPASALRRSPEN